MLVGCWWAKGYPAPLYVVRTRATAAAACRLYEKRCRLEIVETHMTQGGGFTFGACRHPIADCHLGIVDDAPSHEQCHQLAALGQGPWVQSRLQALAQGCHTLAPGGHVHVWLGLSIELPQWLRSTRLALRHLRASARPLLPLDHLGQ